MPETWITLEIEVSNQASDSVSNFLLDIGAGGCVIEDLNLDLVKVVGYLKTEQWHASKEKTETFLKSLKVFFPFIQEPMIHISPLKQENWAIAWQDRFKPMKIGVRLIVAPPWDQPEETENKIVIIIEPAEAFGTGTHETTQGCLILLEQTIEKVVRDSRGCSVLDIGCGSGILALAAVKLGAAPVIAVDSDPVAVYSAKKNAGLNGVAELIEIKLSSLAQLSRSADVVTANLDFRSLVDAAPKLAELSRKYLIIAGVTRTDWDEMKRTFRETGLKLEKEIVDKEWGSGLFSHV
ncbi:MAG: 50S ribosomal protein L11 methyltransferase [Desulfomonilaceae bacterium]|jgi:ribosomal protein L11 methyltransferase